MSRIVCCPASLSVKTAGVSGPTSPEASSLRKRSGVTLTTVAAVLHYATFPSAWGMILLKLYQGISIA